MVFTLANGCNGYVPIEEAFRRDGYEPRIGLQSRLQEEAGELMTNALLELLSGAGHKQS
jgi:hypothetical protein